MICIASMLCTTIISFTATAQPHEPEFATLEDAVDILKHIVGIHRLHSDRLYQFDFGNTKNVGIENAVTILKGIVGITEIPALNALEFESKRLSNTTIDENFCGKVILVVMDRKVGGLNKIHCQTFFGDFPIAKIRDLTWHNGSVRNIPMSSTWRQILAIDLPFECKQNVVDIIEIIEKIDGVRSVSPNHIGNIPLMSELEVQIKTDYLEQFFYLPPIHLPSIGYGIQGVTIERYLGIYNGSVVLRIYSAYEGFTLDVCKDIVSGYEFVYNSGSMRIMVWNNGMFYSFPQAYEWGLITVQDVGAIHFNHTNHDQFQRNAILSKTCPQKLADRSNYYLNPAILLSSIPAIPADVVDEHMSESTADTAPAS